MAEKKSNNDKFFKEDSKKGKSNSQVDFIKGELFDAELEERINSVSIDEDEIDSFEIADLEFDEIDELEINDEIDFEPQNDTSYLATDKKKPTIEVINRKVLTNKSDEKKASKMVSKEATKLVKDFIKQDLPINEVRNILELSHGDKELLMNTPFGSNSSNSQEKKELINKLNDITSSDEVNIANASFVLKWLKNRS
ncbi:MAG: hypothetical protein U0457_04135 [Candidatus Sericytochromatia bacterium]